MCVISFLVPNLVAFSCYMVNIHLEKWLIRCDMKRAIWWDLCNKYISIFCIKHMNTIFRTLQVNKWWSKNQTFFSFCEINATKFGTKIEFHLISFGLYHAVEIDHTTLLLLFVAENVLLLLVISLTVDIDELRVLHGFVYPSWSLVIWYFVVTDTTTQLNTLDACYVRMPSPAYVPMTKFHSGKWRNHMQAWNISILLRNADSSVTGIQLVTALGEPFDPRPPISCKNKNTSVVSYVIRLFNISKLR